MKGIKHDIKFKAKIKGDKVLITAIQNRERWQAGEADIAKYLNQPTQFERWKFIFKCNINRIQSEMLTGYGIDRNADLIKKVIDTALQEAGLYIKTIPEIVEERLRGLNYARMVLSTSIHDIDNCYMHYRMY